MNKVINESKSVAYMIREDGKAIPVAYHPYATDGADYAIDIVPWLFENTLYKSTQLDCRNFTAAYMQYNELTIEDLEDDWGFNCPKGLVNFHEVDNVVTETQLETLAKKLNDDLNEEFCRARFGGTYNSDDLSTGEMVFRISSNHFNWFDVIWKFVYDHSMVKYVTIVRDLEATGTDKVYRDGRDEFYRMPRNDFLNISGNPIIESLFDGRG